MEMEKQCNDLSGSFHNDGSMFVANQFNSSDGDVTVVSTSFSGQGNRGINLGNNSGNIEIHQTLLGEISSDDMPNLHRLLGLSGQKAIQKDVEECLNSLSYQGMRQRFYDIKDSAPDTCKWLLQTNEFKAWIENPTILLIKGKQGSGKSTLVKYLLQQRLHQNQASQDQCMDLSFFFDGRQNSSLQKSALGLYRSLLHELLCSSQNLLANFIQEFRNKRQYEGQLSIQYNWHPNEVRGDLRRLILQALEEYSVRIYIDALDECEPESDIDDIVRFFSELESSSQDKKNNFGICFSCKTNISGLDDTDLRVIVEDSNQEDISKYIRYELATNFESEDRAAVENDLLDRAQGVFQWLAIAIPNLRATSIRGEDVLEAIAQTPTELANIYMDQLKRVKDDDVAELWQLLRWICFASRPLSLIELIAAIGQFSSISEARMEKRVKFLGQALIELKKKENTIYIQFNHQSVRNFMLEGGLMYICTRLPDSPYRTITALIGAVQDELSLTCLNYWITFDLYAQRVNSREIKIKLKKEVEHAGGTRYPFLRYAVSYWAYHASEAEKAGVQQAKLLEILAWPSHALVQKLAALSQSLGIVHDGYPAPGTTLLHIAANENLFSTMQRVMKVDRSLVSKILDLISPLVWFILLLLYPIREVKRTRYQNLANINVKDINGVTPLYLAARKGHLKMVEMILLANGHVGAPKGGDVSPLAAASLHDHADVVRLLLQYDAGVNVVDTLTGCTPLQAASSQGHVGISKLLIDHNADLDMVVSGILTPLLVAILGRHLQVIKLLLDHGSGVNFASREGYAPIIVAAQQGHTEIAQLLLDYKADVNLLDPDGDPPLFISLVKGHTEMVRLFLEHKSIVDSVGPSGMTPLSIALAKGHTEMVQLLLDYKANPNFAGPTGMTPLTLAIAKKDTQLVKLLLDYKANVNFVGQDEMTPLRLAIGQGNQHLVQLLLDYNANASLPNRYGLRPFSLALRQGHLEIAKLLLQYDAEATASKPLEPSVDEDSIQVK